MNNNDIFNPDVPTKVIGYGRGSTVEQKDNWSDKSMRELYAKLRDEFNWGDEPLYYETGSGASLTNRPKLREILTRIEDGENITGIFVVEQDRLTRKEEMYDYARIYSTLMDYNVRVVVMRTIIDLAEDSGNTMFEINSFVAQQTRRNLLRTMKRGKEQKGRAGKNASGPAPDGYCVPIDPITRKSGKYAPDEKRAPIILLIFELADQDYTVRNIKKELDRRGIPSFRGGKQGWSTTHIHNILTNRQYLGIYIQGTTQSVKKRGCHPKKVKLNAPQIVVGTEDNPNHPPLVPKELFYRVQEKLKLRQKREKSGFELLTGLGVCYCCGELMRIWYTGSGKKCYVCKNKMKKDIGCKARWLDVGWANPTVWEKFRTLMERPLVIRKLYKKDNIDKKRIKEQEDQKKNYEAQLQRVEEKNRRLLRLYLDERLNDKEFEVERQELSKTIDFLKGAAQRVAEDLKTQQRSPQDPTERLIQAIITLRYSEAKFTEEQKQKIFRKFVHRVPFLNDRFEFNIEFYQDPLQELPANLCSSHFQNFIIGPGRKP